MLGRLDLIRPVQCEPARLQAVGQISTVSQVRSFCGPSNTEGLLRSEIKWVKVPTVTFICISKWWKQKRNESCSEVLVTHAPVLSLFVCIRCSHIPHHSCNCNTGAVHLSRWNATAVLLIKSITTRSPFHSQPWFMLLGSPHTRKEVPMPTLVSRYTNEAPEYEHIWRC
jgi:hypothetical protein